MQVSKTQSSDKNSSSDGRDPNYANAAQFSQVVQPARITLHFDHVI